MTPPSETTARRINALGSALILLKVVLVLAVIPVLVVGTPYFVRVATHPWSWSLIHENSFTGVWVGTLHKASATASSSRPPDDLGKRIKAEEMARYGAASTIPAAQQKLPAVTVILIKPHLQIFSWLTHVAGTAITCESGDKQTNLVFDMGDFDGDATSLFLKNEKNFTDGGGSLDGLLANGKLDVTYRQDDGVYEGTLSKANEQAFADACAQEPMQRNER